MSAPELCEWFAYFDVGDPLLDLQEGQKADLRTGVVGAVIANCLAGGKKRYKPSDFAPKWEHDRAEQSTEEMKRAAERFCSAFA